MRVARTQIALIAAALAAVVLPVAGTAQENPLGDYVLTREDSLELLRAARSDQASFERFRRNRLPLTWGGGSARCDERIGRFCLNFQKGAPDWIPPAEDPAVTTARTNLIEALDQVARIMPGDEWVAGQRVRYLVEARRFDEAIAAALECRAVAWWCTALLGFAYHYAAEPLEADSAFQRALALMDPEQRNRWTDLSLILDERSLRTYRRLPEEERPAFQDHFWRLADPSLARPGNELRSEHLARQVWDEFQRVSETPDGISWGYDLREIVVRYGWPSGWEQTRDFGPASAGRAPLITHYAGAPFNLLPPWSAILGEPGAEGIWEVEEQRSRTAYSIPLEDSISRWFDPLPHQIAVFHRGDSAVVVAGYELPADSVPADARVDAGLAVLPTTDRTLEPVVSLTTATGPNGALMVETATQPMIISLEIVVPSERRLARARYGVDLRPPDPQLIALSDLLLLRGDSTLPEALPDAVELARGSTRVRGGDQVGLYWEVYGVNPRTTPQLTFSLQLLQARPGWLRRFGERIGLLREVAPIRLRWQEGVEEGPYLPRSLHVQIPEVSPGDYAIELRLEAPGREPLSVRRDIQITR